ncbi:MAG: methylmalonyl-CoA mutase family protein, partial [Clostridiales bacterium]
MEQLNLPAWDGGAVAESEYIAAPWRIAQGADALLPKEANGMLREHILQGGNGVSLDLTAGLYLETVEDMLELFDKVCPRDNPLNIYCGATPIPFLSLLKLRSLHLGYESRTYRGCAGGDPVGEYALRGKLPADMDCYLDQFAAAMRWLVMNAPGVKCIFIRSAVYHNGGADPGQELGCVMAAARVYIEGLLQRGQHIDDIAHQIRLEFSLSDNLMLEAAKLRAARRIWARMIAAYGGGGAARKADISGVDSAFYRNSQQPELNVLRSAGAAMAAVCGGVEQLQLMPGDVGEHASSLGGRQLARNTQLLLANQLQYAHPAALLATSPALEQQICQLAVQGWDYLRQIEQAGGMMAALEDGLPQTDIAAAFQQKQIDFVPLRLAQTGLMQTAEQAAGDDETHRCAGLVREARAKALAAHHQQVDSEAVAQNLANIDGCVCTVMAAMAA